MTATTTVELVSVTWRTIFDDNPDLSWLEQDYNDVEDTAERKRCREQASVRLEAYNHGDWHSVGVVARAELLINGIAQDIESPGLWGIESDSDDAYFEDVAREQLEELHSMLQAFRLEDSDIDRAVEAAERTD